MISENGLFELINKYMKEYGPGNIQLESFNHFIMYGIDKIINQHYKVENDNDKFKYIVEFKNPIVENPYVIEEDRSVNMVTPNDCRYRDLFYEGILCVDIHEKKIDKSNIILEHKIHKRYILGRIPVMLHSIKCNLYNKSETYLQKCGECMYDKGGYFIIRGKERVLVAQERINYNIPYVFEQKRTSKYSYVCEIRSMDKIGKSSMVLIKLSKTNILYVTVPFVKEDIPLGILLKLFNFSEEELSVIPKDFLIKIKQTFDNYTIEEAKEYIIENSIQIIPDDHKEDFINNLIKNEIFPHLNLTIHSNKQYLLYMIQLLILTIMKKIEPNDRDHISNKRCEVAGILMYDLFKSLWKKLIKNLEQMLIKRCDVLTLLSRINYITQGFRQCFSTGNWSIHKNTYVRTGVSQILNRLTYSATISHLKRLVIPVGKEGKNTKIRQIHNSQFGYICPSETPEGHSAGVVKNFSLLTRVSNHIKHDDVLSIIKPIVKDCSKGSFKIMLNGIIIGFTDDHNHITNQFLELRNNNLLHKDISISNNEIKKEILLYSDGGRLLRPLIDVNNFITDDDIQNYTWNQLVQLNKIVYIDSYEIENKVVSMFSHKEVLPNSDYAEIHPCLMLSVCSSIIPYPDHTQSPRNTYQSAMGKQAIGIYSTANNLRTDTVVHELIHPQKPLVFTKPSSYMNFNEMGSGSNVIVAICCYTGFNQEDSVILNKSSIDKGLFRSYVYKTITTTERRINNSSFEKICIPDLEIRNKTNCYTKLDKDGLIKINEKLNVGDVIIGKITSKNKNHITTSTDVSISVKQGETGVVDKVYKIRTPDGYDIIKVRIRSLRIPEVGDKFASREAQKGTCGMVFPKEDMPFTSSGIVPDVIINPHCIPSRMTINQLLECIGAKSSVINGEFRDSTAFSNNSTNIINKLQSELEKCGYNNTGNEVLFNGFTGEKIKSTIFIGPTYYQRLKHLVKDKIHARDRGHVQSLTRQPLEGRSRDGGLRFGEMERDCMISHGLSTFLKERLYDMSDPYTISVCKHCKQIIAHENKCHICNKYDIANKKIPYACKLLFQELITLGIKINIE